MLIPFGILASGRLPLSPFVPISFAVIAGGGGSGTGGGGANGGAGGFRKSFATELSGGGAPSESPLSIAVGTSIEVTVGAGSASSNGSISKLGSITSTGGGRGGNSTQAGSSGGSGGGGGGGFCPGYAGSSGGTGTAGQGFNGSQGGPGSESGGNCSYGGGGSGGGAGGLGGVGLATLIRGTSETYATGNPATAPNTGNAKQSGIVIARYPKGYTITVGAGLTSATTNVGDDKITTFTAGTGNVSWTA